MVWVGKAPGGQGEAVLYLHILWIRVGGRARPWKEAQGSCRKELHSSNAVPSLMSVRTLLALQRSVEAVHPPEASESQSRERVRVLYFPFLLQ